MTIEPDLFIRSERKSQVREQTLADLACRQHGVVARRQLFELGFTSTEVQRRMDAGRLHRVWQGVYAVGHRRMTWKGRYMAAVLACGPGAALSHRSAAVLHGILRGTQGVIHVAVPATGRPKRTGIRLHEASKITQDTTTVDGLPTTSVPLTLLFLAAATKPETLNYALEESERLSLFDLTAVDELLGRHKGARGAKRLKQALIDYRPPPAWTRSDFERRFLEELRKAGLPQPAVNNWVAGHEVDCVYFQQKLAIELDGGNYHHTTKARQRDPERDADLQLAGYRIIRITDRRLANDPKGVMATIRRFLNAAPASR